MSDDTRTHRPLPSLRWAVGGILLVGVLTRVLGVGREVIIAWLFGTGPELDGIYLGLSIPMALCIGLGGGISRAAVPVGAALAAGPFGGFAVMALRRTAAIAVPFSALLALTSPWWAMALIPAGTPIPLEAVLWAAGLGSLGIAGATLSGLCMGFANAQGRHVTTSFGHLFYNVLIIGSVVLLHQRLGVYSLLVGTLLAEWGQILVIGPFLRDVTRRIEEAAPTLLWDLNALFWPSAGLAVIAGLNRTVDRYFAATLAEGSVSALSYADRLLYLPTTLLGMALAQPLYTRLSRFVTSGDGEGFRRTLELGIRIMLLLGVPMGLLVTGFAEGLIALLLERGAFTSADTALASGALRGYAAAIVFYSMTPLVTSAGMAQRRGWTMLWITLATVPANALLDAILVAHYGLLGIAAATSVLSAAGLAAMIAVCAPQLFREPGIWRSAALAVLLAALGTGALLLFRGWWPPPPTGFAAYLAWLTAGTAAVLAGMGIPAAPLLLREWRSIAGLRTLVAGHAGLAPAVAPSKD